MSLIYKWIILYFISLGFYCFKNQFKLVYLKYSKNKIGHNFLPGLVRRNLNADLSLSVLRKKVISKIKIVNSDAFHNLILISGRCSWREDVSTTSKKLTWCNVDDVDANQQRQYDATSEGVMWRGNVESDVTWHRRQSHGLEEIEIRLHGQPS